MLVLWAGAPGPVDCSADRDWLSGLRHLVAAPAFPGKEPHASWQATRRKKIVRFFSGPLIGSYMSITLVYKYVQMTCDGQARASETQS